ncbi:MAG: polyprenyl diphosphate synthase [Angelakisella sp.]
MAIGKTAKPPIPKEHMPKHVAFIMDGNGRWAQQRNLPRVEGHRAGAKAMENISRYAAAIGIETVTFYAFSTENWKRSKEEVGALMMLLEEFLDTVAKRSDENAKLIILGDVSALSSHLQSKILAMQERTSQNPGIVVNIAFNYGARSELVHGIRALAQRCIDGTLSPDAIDEATVSGALYTAGQQDPDMIIRPSGEKRLSNFLLWQAAYTELLFMDVLWPDFSPKYLDEAIREYGQRDRRFGGR